MASNRASSANWFRQPNVWRGLIDNAPGLQPIEADLQVLDAASWALFKAKAALRAHLMDSWGYSRALFDCFNEIKGYQYLMQEGYEEVRFVPEQPAAKTPDVQARSQTGIVLMEVKTVNESTKQKDYFEIPGDQRIALPSELRVSDALKGKVVETIARARLQLLAVQRDAIDRRIVYIVIRPDFHVHAEEDLASFLSEQNTPDVDVLYHLLG